LGAFINLTGKHYGQLEVIRRVDNINNRTTWLCRCSCGTYKAITGHDLTSGKTKSCGCLRRKEAARRATKHGCSREPIYAVWIQMHQRCENPRNKNYSAYGGRGIKVCPEWNSFPVFKNWAMKSGYQPHLTIDHINVDGNYSPENCRWIPLKDQMTNRRSSLSYHKKHSMLYSGTVKE
jgi:hypothetical protein